MATVRAGSCKARVPSPGLFARCSARTAHRPFAVARCESGLSVNAANGQYLGLFQMGSYARSRYGHSGTAIGQARAAYAYFRDSGYGWGPWACRP